MINDIEKLIKTVTEEIRNFTDIAVIGMSGGADSTLVATLCTIALEKKNVYGYGMPYNENDFDTFNNRSRKIATKLGIFYALVPISDSVDHLFHRIEDTTGNKISSLNLGNIKSRVRMVLLYSLNARLSETTGKRCRVIGTGNLSEDFIGYETKGGDALADIFPIGLLFKSEVYQLLDYFVKKGILKDEMIDRVPSAGLEPGQTDEEDLGYSYNEMEPAIKFCLANYDRMDFVMWDEIVDFVWKRHLENKHKHEMSKVINLKKFTGD